MIIYLANPYGFSKQQRIELLPKIVAKIESFGHTVWEPFKRTSQILDSNDPNWPYAIGQVCKKDVENCDAIFAIINGTPPDEGVMIEIGIGIALNKKIYLFRDDFRRCTDSPKYPLNLMIFCSLPKEGWEKYYFTSVEEIEL